MRHGVARLMTLGLILAFPVLIVIASPSPRRTGLRPVLGVEVVLGVGLAFAARERKRLLAPGAPASSAPAPVRRRFRAPAPHALPAGVHAPAAQ